MEVKTGEFVIIDGRFYAEYVSYGSVKLGTQTVREPNAELKKALEAKCTQWDKAHPEGYKGVTDPDAPENHVPGGTVSIGRQNGKVYVYMDPGVDEAFLPVIKAAFGLESVPENKVVYKRNGHKWCLFDFTAWNEEHPDFKMKQEATVPNNGDVKSRTVCFTGHRKIPYNEVSKIKSRLKREVEDLIKQGYCAFRAGGALGFDTLAAQTVLALKRQYPEVKLILDLPCTTQADNWQDQDRVAYIQIIRAADEVIYVSEDYSRDCMFKRNRHLVDHSNVCICYLTEVRGGTAYTVNYAEGKGLKVINVAVG